MTSNAESLINKLRLAQCSSCSCLTKTPEVSWHESTCLYRVLSEAISALTTPAEDVRAVDEPVAWANSQQLQLCEAQPFHVEHSNKIYHDLPRPVAGSALETEYCNTPLYRHAQRQMVMPELLDNDDPWSDGWGACLDELKRLNP